MMENKKLVNLNDKKRTYIKNKVIFSYNHQIIMEDWDLNSAIRKSACSKMRINAEFGSKLEENVTKS